jgi:hypothetical protein
MLKSTINPVFRHKGLVIAAIAITALGFYGSVDTMSAFAQVVENRISTSQDATQAADSSADDNTQVNNAEVTQTQAAIASCEEYCNVEAEQEDNTQTSTVTQSNSIRTGDVTQEQDVTQTQELEDIVQGALQVPGFDTINIFPTVRAGFLP